MKLVVPVEPSALTAVMVAYSDRVHSEFVRNGFERLEQYRQQLAVALPFFDSGFRVSVKRCDFCASIGRGYGENGQSKF